MKSLLLGNDAVARGLYEAGCAVASSYPGTPSTEITETLAEYNEIYSEWAPNEKIALEVAFGASLAGRRSFAGMKHVGLNVAADPLFTISYTGINAGLVIAVADDQGMHSSQNEQDSRHYAIAAKVPMLEPADSAECLEYAKYAFELSEKFDTPVLLRMCTRIAHSQSVAETGDRILPPRREYIKDASKYVMMPAFAKARHHVVEKRTTDLTALAEDTFLNRIEPGGTELGIITSGTAYQYVKEVFGDTVSVLKLGLVNPLPTKLIQTFAAGVNKLIVVEELDGIIETHCKGLGLPVIGKEIFPLTDEFSQNLVAEKIAGATGIIGSAEGIAVVTSASAAASSSGAATIEGAAKTMDSAKEATASETVAAEGTTAASNTASNSTNKLDETIPTRPPVMCAGCPHRGVFYTLSKLGLTVLGDIGCYTLGASAPLSAIDTTLCMGASISNLHGFNKAGGENAVAVIGDSTFMHTGLGGLIDIVYNESDSTVIILDNSITGMTGHQENPTTGLNIKGEPAGKIDLEALCRSLGIKSVRVVDPYDLAACETAIKEETASAGPSVIIARRPCVLLKTVKAKQPYTADTEKCIGCSACMKMGCPAISIKGKKAVIDSTLCVGCGVCTQLCKFDALKAAGGEAQ